MKIFSRILVLALGLFLTACTEVIDVDLDTASPKLVIDASIDWIKNTPGNEQKIKLSTTTGYYSSEFPTVSGATVFITNSANSVFNFVETGGVGEYICTDFVPVIGETYLLTVVLNGETYTATETLIEVPVIESTITQNDSGGFGGDQTEIRFSYQDNGAQENYYMTGIKTVHVAFPEYSLESDEFYQGNQIVEFYFNEDLEQGDLVNIKLYGVSKRFYEYFNKILLATGNDGNPFPVTPTTVKGNIVNQTNVKNYALGFFRLSEVDNRDYTIQ